MYMGGIFREKNFLFLINEVVLDISLSKSFFKSKKRNSLQKYFQIEKAKLSKLIFELRKQFNKKKLNKELFLIHVKIHYINIF